MAKQTASQVTAWKKSEAIVEVEDTGNILTPLERMYEYYVQKACALYQQAQFESPDAIIVRLRGDDVELGESKRERVHRTGDYYKASAEAVRALIIQGSPEVA